MTRELPGPVSIRRDEERPPDQPMLAPYLVACPSVLTYGHELHRVPREALGTWITEIVGVESPVHVSEAARRIADAAGVQRIGSRIQDALDAAYQVAVQRGQVQRRGDFLWSPRMQQPVLRDRSQLPPLSRRLDLVAPEEIALAITREVGFAYGIKRDDIPPAVCRLIGFGRVSEEMRSIVDAIVARMLADKRLLWRNHHVICPEEGGVTRPAV